jgi:thymidylate synthase
MHVTRPDFGSLWVELVRQLINRGDRVRPRGLDCWEVCGVSIKLEDAQQNLLVNEVRRLPYKFAIAEWLWIYFGHADVKTIARYNPNIAKFSDDGFAFRGAYGPRVYGRDPATHRVDQWYHVLDQLRRDPDTRQAVIVIFATNELVFPTKDVPCTVDFQLFNRRGRLNAILHMRSSDVWLGLPFDVFTFTMLQAIAAAELGLEVGWFKAWFGSSHLYEVNLAAAKQAVLPHTRTSTLTAPRLTGAPPDWLDEVLESGAFPEGADFGRTSSPWPAYCRVLTAPSNAVARQILEDLTQDRPGVTSGPNDGNLWSSRLPAITPRRFDL